MFDQPTTPQGASSPAPIPPTPPQAVPPLQPVPKPSAPPSPLAPRPSVPAPVPSPLQTSKPSVVVPHEASSSQGMVEDIFSETDKTHGAPSQAGLPPSQSLPQEQSAGFFHGKVLWAILGAVILVVLVGGGAYLAFFGRTKVTPPVVETPAEPLAPVPAVTETPPAAATPALDTDRDGLSDTDEASYGTDPQKPDTDGDGLSDADEIRVYKTNALVPDTDGDSYLDGAEVQAGYDPNGPGKLQDINKALGQ